MSSTTATPAPVATRPAARRLTAGVIAPPVFLVVSFLQMPFNPGLDLTKHAFSYLSIGPTGLLQQANFVVMGLLNIVAATGLPYFATGRLGRFAAVLLGLTGLGQVIAGVFTLDPSNGFPEGAPEGLPETVSVHGNLHGIGFAMAIISWVLLLLVLARTHSKAGRRHWALANGGFALALVVTAACLMTPFGTVLLYVVLTSTWLFTAADLRRIGR
ncbi:DUF998 domain-containing protein [Dactylosporangium sp. AC04546]|uniref:DUF998 domain-containing protein n=1 Tax=Dactylosporangium sp. AC04546 TaxID=2862460 RepID=UPI001EE0EA30|nr:DUF998 domain-containing protein [Dactylosporangium sp. AC04546]WVK79551.1 DUF998 domain-containing protein [Dactylosporangium sp. AC04546]